ncbi:MAG: hypothetical protein K0S51_1192 [Bacillales bacterium]|jgi:hypothetical protein|nr:hypothetical protein [Bacillales bacterium]
MSYLSKIEFGSNILEKRGRFYQNIMASIFVSSINVKLHYIILVNFITIIVSVILGTSYITPPNGSWFNPFGMNFAIIFTHIVFLIFVLIVRSIFKNMKKLQSRLKKLMLGLIIQLNTH